jgi:hypothetical protein
MKDVKFAGILETEGVNIRKKKINELATRINNIRWR